MSSPLFAEPHRPEVLCSHSPGTIHHDIRYCSQREEELTIVGVVEAGCSTAHSCRAVDRLDDVQHHPRPAVSGRALLPEQHVQNIDRLAGFQMTDHGSKLGASATECERRSTRPHLAPEFRPRSALVHRAGLRWLRGPAERARTSW